jgi:hypothetical protein
MLFHCRMGTPILKLLTSAILEVLTTTVPRCVMSEIIDIEHARQSESTDIEHACLTETKRFFRHYYPLFYIATIPIYAGISLLRKGRGHLTVNRLLRATWLVEWSGW